MNKVSATSLVKILIAENKNILMGEVDMLASSASGSSSREPEKEVCKPSWVSTLKEFIMTTVAGTYFNGLLSLDNPINTSKPIKITLSYEEDRTDFLTISDFSFLESQEKLKNVKGSLSDEVIEERRDN